MELYFNLIAALLSGQPAAIDTSFAYLGSLFYLAIIGTVLAFLAYLKILGEIGPERASYIFVLLPIVAMSISTIYEDFQWTSSTFIGLAIVILGNIIVIKKKPLKNVAQSVIPAKAGI